MENIEIVLDREDFKLVKNSISLAADEMDTFATTMFYEPADAMELLPFKAAVDGIKVKPGEKCSIMAPWYIDDVINAALEFNCGDSVALRRKGKTNIFALEYAEEVDEREYDSSFKPDLYDRTVDDLLTGDRV